MVQIYNEHYQHTQPQTEHFPVWVAKHYKAKDSRSAPYWQIRQAFAKGFDTGGNGDLLFFTESEEYNVDYNGDVDFAEGYLWCEELDELQATCVQVVADDIHIRYSRDADVGI